MKIELTTEETLNLMGTISMAAGIATVASAGKPDIHYKMYRQTARDLFLFANILDKKLREDERNEKLN